MEKSPQLPTITEKIDELDYDFRVGQPDDRSDGNILWIEYVDHSTESSANREGRYRLHEIYVQRELLKRKLTDAFFDPDETATALKNGYDSNLYAIRLGDKISLDQIVETAKLSVSSWTTE